MYKILVVEDNQDMREAVCQALIQDGNQVIAASSAEQARELMFKDDDFDLGILDINLPGESGIDLTNYIRDLDINVPLVAITARDSLQERIEGLESGFTDYVVKPFDLNELVARVHAHLRQVGHNEDQQMVIRTQTYEIRPEAFEFLVEDKQVELTKIEFRIMQKLMERNTVMVPLDDIIEFAWGEQSDLISPPIRIHIANLRKKINDDDFTIIKTIPGTGYKLNDGPAKR